MSDLFNKFISTDKNPIEYLVTPITPYFICNHFISTEINKDQANFIETELELKANNLLENKNYNDIQNFDIIQIQVQYLNLFYDEILPIITKNNIKVIIITSQFWLPQIHKSDKTDLILNHNHILLWISQNPIYMNHAKYMAFPYGLYHKTIDQYVNFIKSNCMNTHKHIKILNQRSSPHPHLPDNHIRKKYDIFGINSGPMFDYTEYLTNILNAEFVISTAGDRDDCYRHYESIGLNAIPISNITNGYKEIFLENMVYSNGQDMVDMVNTQTINYTYRIPDKNVLIVDYWLQKINDRMNLLKTNT